MSVCQRCWRDSRSADESLGRYYELLDSRQCTPEQQAGPDAGQCPVCKRMTLHEITLDPMCECPQQRTPESTK